jgi:hypothetical protein
MTAVHSARDDEKLTDTFHENHIKPDLQDDTGLREIPVGGIYMSDEEKILVSSLNDQADDRTNESTSRWIFVFSPSYHPCT